MDNISKTNHFSHSQPYTKLPFFTNKQTNNFKIEGFETCFLTLPKYWLSKCQHCIKISFSEQ